MTDDDDLPIQSSRPSRALRRRSVPIIPLHCPAPSFAPNQPAVIRTHVDQRDERLSRGTQDTCTTSTAINISGLVSALASTLPERGNGSIREPRSHSGTRSTSRSNNSEQRCTLSDGGQSRVDDIACYRHLATLAQQFSGGPPVLSGSTKAVRIGLKPDSLKEAQTLETPPRARDRQTVGSFAQSTLSPQLPADTASWTVQEACAWLERIGLVQYRKRFVHHAINGALLLRLTPAQVKEELGINSLGHQTALLEAQRLIKQQHHSSSGLTQCTSPGQAATPQPDSLIRKQQRRARLERALERARSRESHCAVEAQHAQHTAELAQEQVRQLRAQLVQIDLGDRSERDGKSAMYAAEHEFSNGALSNSFRFRQDLVVISEEVSSAGHQPFLVAKLADPEAEAQLPAMLQDCIGLLKDRLSPDVVEAVMRRKDENPVRAVACLATALRFRRFEERYQADLARRRRYRAEFGQQNRDPPGSKTIAQAEKRHKTQLVEGESDDHNSDPEEQERAPQDQASRELAMARQLLADLGWPWDEVHAVAGSAEEDQLATRIENLLDEAADFADDDDNKTDPASRSGTVLGTSWTTQELISCLSRCHPEELQRIRDSRGSFQILLLYRAARAQRFIRAVQDDLWRRSRRAAAKEAEMYAQERKVLTPEEQDRFVDRLMEDARRRLQHREEIARKAELERFRTPAELSMAALARHKGVPATVVADARAAKSTGKGKERHKKKRVVTWKGRTIEDDVIET